MPEQEEKRPNRTEILQIKYLNHRLSVGPRFASAPVIMSVKSPLDKLLPKEKPNK